MQNGFEQYKYIAFQIFYTLLYIYSVSKTCYTEKKIRNKLRLWRIN